MTNKKVAVVGGGLSGLLVSYLLLKKGYKVTIYEKEKEIGGELAAIKIGGKWLIEKFYHHLFGISRETQDLFLELGICNKLHHHQSSMAVVKNGKIYPLNTAFDLFRLSFLSLITKIRLALGSLYVSHIRRWQKLEKKAASNYIKRLMGICAWQDFWQPLFVLKFGELAAKISAVWFWARIKDRMSERKGNEKLGYFEGSFQVFLDSLAKKITESGGKIITNLLITKIVQKENKFQVSGELFDKVICCVPLPVFNQIVPPKAKMQSSPKHLAALTVLLELSEKITNYYWINILDKDLPFVVMIEHTNLINPENYGKNLIYLGCYLDPKNSLYQKSDQEVAEIFISALTKLFPKAKQKIQKCHVFRDNYAQPVVETNYQKPSFSTNIKNLYVFSAAHIYPEDRGIENVIKNTQSIIVDITK